jgi:hypothetical protein
MARKPSTRILTGDKKLDAKLNRLKTVGAHNRIVRPAMTKALRILVRAIKAQVPSQYKDAKRTIGSVFNKKGGMSRKETQAKAGAGVGRGHKAEAKKRKRKGSVGISGRNIHWFVLGTGMRTRKSGGSTGRMPRLLENIVKNGFQSAEGRMMAVVRDEVNKRLAIEAAKK